MRLKSITAYRIITHFSRSNKGRASNSILCNIPLPAPLQTSCWVKSEVTAKPTAGTASPTAHCHMLMMLKVISAVILIVFLKRGRMTSTICLEVKATE